MGIHCGVDIIEIDRVKKTIEASGEPFIEKVFTIGEAKYCKSKKAVCFKSYAARFAAKEAVAKALGTGINEGISWTDIEVCLDETGKPYPVLHGMAKQRFNEMAGTDITLSLSHCDEYAVAYAVILSKS